MKRKSDESKKNINNSKGMATCGNVSPMATEAYHFNRMNGNLSTLKTHEVPETIVFKKIKSRTNLRNMNRTQQFK